MNNLEWIQSKRIYSDENNSLLVDMCLQEYALERIDLTLKSLSTEDLVVLVKNSALHE